MFAAAGGHLTCSCSVVSPARNPGFMSGCRNPMLNSHHYSERHVAGQPVFWCRFRTASGVRPTVRSFAQVRGGALERALPEAKTRVLYNLSALCVQEDHHAACGAAVQHVRHASTSHRDTQARDADDDFHVPCSILRIWMRGTCPHARGSLALTAFVAKGCDCFPKAPLLHKEPTDVSDPAGVTRLVP